MIVTATTCECCDDVTYHLPFKFDDLSTWNGEVIVHLNEDEMTDLYFQLKEYKCGLKAPEQPYA